MPNLKRMLVVPFVLAEPLSPSALQWLKLPKPTCRPPSSITDGDMTCCTPPPTENMPPENDMSYVSPSKLSNTRAPIARRPKLALRYGRFFGDCVGTYARVPISRCESPKLPS